MLTIQHNISLLALNTLGINVNASHYCEIIERQQLPEALAFAAQQQLECVVLGGGSNCVLTADIAGLVIKIALQGIDIEERGSNVILTAAAGENWHQLVQYCLQQGYNGLENLALIPGTVGAAPIQNIGAYGVELEQLLISVDGWDVVQQQWLTLDRNDCQFDYRDSIFKQTLKDRFIITSVTLCLSTNAAVNVSYGALQQYFSQAGITAPTAQQVADAVIKIRRSKLPDPDKLANVGSFFKNPLVDQLQADSLVQQYPELVCYPQGNGRVKLAAGWLLQQAGWKGRRQGPVGMHEQQSLVLINYQQGSGADVLALARSIQQDISRQFSVELEIEPRLY